MWGSVSILSIFMLIAPFIQYYYGYEEEVHCGTDCWVEFCMKNGNKNLYFYNYDELPLTFEPAGAVSDVKFYKKDGRFKTGYRPIDFITPYTKGRKYVFKIAAYGVSCYGMNITKDKYATVKWTFGGLDPYLIGDDVPLESIQDCWIEFYNEDIRIYENVTYYRLFGYTESNDSWYNWTSSDWNGSLKVPQELYTKSEFKGYKTIQKNRTICKTVFYKYGDELLNATEWCCHEGLCGLIKDYDCNYIQEQRKQPNHSYKELDTGLVEIQDADLREHYYTEKPKLAEVDTNSFTIK